MYRELPRGVYTAKNKRYFVLKQINGKQTYLGTYANPEEASQAFLAGVKLETAVTKRGRQSWKRESIESSTEG